MFAIKSHCLLLVWTENLRLCASSLPLVQTLMETMFGNACVTHGDYPCITFERDPSPSVEARILRNKIRAFFL